MSNFDEIDPEIPTGTVEYWKARARQWQKRCRRAEAEKTELIAELNRIRTAADRERAHEKARRAAILRGDTYA